MILQEVYFGKSINIQRIEDLLTAIRNKYKDEGVKAPALVVNKVNRDPMMLKVTDLIKDQFNFKEVIFTIRHDNELRAYTICYVSSNKSLLSLDQKSQEELKDSVILTQDGPIFNHKNLHPNMLIVFSTGILFSDTISIPELMAALLHEIGHAFSKSIIGSKEFDVRIDEKHADSFATMYGYGPELNGALTKISTYNQFKDHETLRKIPIINVFVSLKNIFGSVWNRMVIGNEHPSIAQRMNNTIAQLELDLAKSENLTIAQRKELEGDLNKAKQVRDTYYNSSPTLGDAVYRGYMHHVEPRLPREALADRHADQYGSIEDINQFYSDLYMKQKGYFKSYKKVR